MSRQISPPWCRSVPWEVLHCERFLLIIDNRLTLQCFVLCDRIGRLWATRQLCVIWILGVVIFLTNGGRLGQVYAGRFIAGLGIGQTTVVAPVYLSEIAPKSVEASARVHSQELSTSESCWHILRPGAAHFISHRN